MKIPSFLRLLLVGGICCVVNSEAMNLTQPYYAYMKPRYNPDSVFQAYGYAEKGFAFKGYAESCLVGPLRIWQKKQNALAMLQGFSETSEQGILLGMLQMDPQQCALVCIDGELKHEYSLGFGLRYYLPLNFSIAGYLPFYKLSLECPTWKSETTLGCERTQELLFKNFANNVKELGAGLNVGGWTRSGFGDLTVLLEWTRDFAQYKEFLKNVRLNCRCGPSFPTGKRCDEDLILAFPFGFDGCTGLIFGGQLELLLGKYLRCGIDVELTHLFGNTRERRIKIGRGQTELLLLKKVCAYRDPGLIQHFNLFLGFYDLFGGMYVAFDYEFYKRGEDRFSIVSNDYSNDIANSAESLDRWTAHHGIFKLGYDLACVVGDDARIKPTFTLYTRVPFDGTRSVLNTTVGFIVNLDF